MEIQGTIKEIKKTETVGSNNFQKRDLILVTNEQYPQYLSIQFVQDKCSILDNFGSGEMVTVGVNLRGREWVNPKGETVYFNTIQGWRIARDTQVSQEQPTPQQTNTQVNTSQEEHDDLPF